MSHEVPVAFGPMTGVRDQGMSLRVAARDQPNADYLGAGTRQEQEKNAADAAAYRARAVPHRAGIETR